MSVKKEMKRLAKEIKSEIDSLNIKYGLYDESENIETTFEKYDLIEYFSDKTKEDVLYFYEQLYKLPWDKERRDDILDTIFYYGVEHVVGNFSETHPLHDDIYEIYDRIEEYK